MMDFYKGMDISGLPELEAEGKKIKDFDGTEMDGFDLAAKYGVNAIRLRLWNNPENVKESKGYCGLSDTIAMAKRIKAHGMSFMLDFHYSDFWADPGQQRKPLAWKTLGFEELKEAVFSFTRDTLERLKNEGVLPEIVQIGNEIRSGLLFPDGELPDYVHMAELVNAGIRGARAAADSDTMKVMIHLDQGGRYFYLKEWFEKSIAAGLLDFDFIGLSYYPFWHGTFADLKQTLEKLAADYRKPIMIVETAHAWRKSRHGFIDESQEKVAGVKASREGQKKVLELVANITASLPDHMGMGIYYWEPFCIPSGEDGGWSENMGLLDETGTVMEGICAFEFTRDKLRLGEVAKVYEPGIIKIAAGDIPGLPEELSVLFYDGTIEKRKVKWRADGQKWELGPHTIDGVVEKFGISVICRVEVLKEIPVRQNLLADANWDDGLTRWELSKSEDQVISQIFPEFEEPFPAPPVNALRVEAPKNFTFSVSQQVEIVRPGFYNLQVEYMGTDTTNVDIRLFIDSEDGTNEVMIHPTEHEWGIYEVKNVFCNPQKLTAGIRISSPPVYGMMRKFCLYQSKEDTIPENKKMEQ